MSEYEDFKIEIDYEEDTWFVRNLNTDDEFTGTFRANRKTEHVGIEWDDSDLPEDWEKIEHLLWREISVGYHG